jgi:DNA-binding transcriptional LysR family regulator
VDTRRLELLVELSRLGSMREVADSLEVTTSTVSQQIAALAREVGAPLIEPVGRRVRLTPAGRRLAEHGVGILAAVESALHDLEPDADPVGVVRVAGFATAIRRSLMPLIEVLAASHPRVQLVIREHEPAEAVALLADDLVDLALTYDYNLAPADVELPVSSVPLWSTPWCLAVPTVTARPGTGRGGSRIKMGSAVEVFGRYRDHVWIVNSRSSSDERVVRTLASMAGFVPRLSHRVDSLDLVEDLVAAGLGVGLLPSGVEVPDGVAVLPLTNPDVELRAYAHTRQGRSAWAPLSLVVDLLSTGAF